MKIKKEDGRLWKKTLLSRRKYIYFIMEDHKRGWNIKNKDGKLKKIEDYERRVEIMKGYEKLRKEMED